MTYIVGTDAALARILGVTRPAIADAERRGKIRRRRDGWWDVLQVVCDWRHNTWGGLQRPHRASVFRPWLDVDLPLRGSILVELERRAVAEGAEHVDECWRAGDSDFEEEDLVLEDGPGPGGDDFADTDDGSDVPR